MAPPLPEAHLAPRCITGGLASIRLNLGMVPFNGAHQGSNFR
ncbi:hypothetical protein BZA02_103147 [Ruegeria sp. P4]|nr:hypothetical protein BZA02_103147 [Ruegeria sp. P4]